MKKIKLYEEPTYVLATVLLALSVAMIAAADFGVSMIVGTAYIVSLKVSFLTFGTAEYIVQGLLFIAFCIIMKKVKLTYFFSFFTCLFYGFVLDLWRSAVPALNPSVTAPGSFSMPVRITLFVLGSLLTSASVALFFKVYLCPQVYDFFVKTVSGKFSVPLPKFKTFFDIVCLLTALILSLAFFGGIKGIGVGTVIMAFLNGTIIGLFGKLYDKIFVFEPIFKKAAKIFEQ